MRCRTCDGTGEYSVSFHEAGSVDVECEDCFGTGERKSGYCARCDVYPVDMVAHVCRGMPASIEHWHEEPREDGT